MALLFQSLQRGRKCRESVARCRDTALIAMLLVGFSARFLLRLDVADLRGMRLPQPVWWAVLAWVRRRASIPGTIECKRLFIHAHCRPLHPRGLYLLLNRRAQAAGLDRPISVSGLRLSTVWQHEPLTTGPEGLASIGHVGERRRRLPILRPPRWDAGSQDPHGVSPTLGQPNLPHAAAVRMLCRLEASLRPA